MSAVPVGGSVAFPDRLEPDMAADLAGRARERDSLLEALDAAEAGERRVTFLAGEPGIGKTRLAAELAAHAHARGAVVLYGRADEAMTVPYEPWVGAITHLLEHAPPALMDEMIRCHGAVLGTLVPDLRRRFPTPPTPTEPETELDQLFQAVTACLTLVAADAPLLLVLDDLQWAGNATLTLLRYVCTNTPAASLMIVAAYRDADLYMGHPLISTVAALRRETGIELIAVRGLDDLDMIALVETSAGHELDDRARALAVVLRQETAGNPFFAHEILRNLIECGDLFQDDSGHWVVKQPLDELVIPQSIRDVVGQRVARLGEETLEALSAAAVIGREFDLCLLADVTGADEGALLDMVESATAAGILAEVPSGDERFRFQQSLVRHTLVSGLSEGRRRRLHRSVAEALEVICGADPGVRIGELATHWLAATTPADASKVSHYARLAGQQAEASLAPEEAVTWFTAALENLDLGIDADPQIRAELLVDLGTAQKHAGDSAFRQTLLEAGALARRLGDTDLLAAAELANRRAFTSDVEARDGKRIGAPEPR
jgi:predicted ATPase